MKIMCVTSTIDGFYRISNNTNSSFLLKTNLKLNF